MTTRNETIVEGIYQNGVITPLEPLNLPEKAVVKIHIAAPEQPPKGSLARYKGILSGQGDFSLVDIRKIVGTATDAHLDKLVEKLEADDE